MHESPSPGSGSPGGLSSTSESQSLSRPLHFSVDGPTAPTQTSEPFWHALTPNAHSPTSVVTVPPPGSVLHCWPSEGSVSSVAPLQLSSRLLQTSGNGPTCPT